MHISKRDAMKTVTEISAIINQNVNMMDENGVIIGSTDPERLGTFHEGAKKIIDKKLDMLAIYDTDRYSGSCPGINLPILFQNQIVGVVGVTGNTEEVVRYGKIIKKMTEILLWDNYLKERQNLDEILKKRFLEDWIFGGAGKITPQFFEQGQALGFNIQGRHRILIAAADKIGEYKSPEDQHRLEKADRRIRLLLQNETNLFLKNNSGLICILGDLTNPQMETVARKISQDISDTLSVGLNIGIDGGAVECQMIHISYEKAEKALHACKLLSEESVRFYDDINVEIFASEISASLKREYIQKVFKNCTGEEILQWVTLLHAFFAANGSIIKAAQILYIHKNTLQYKINKLRNKIGYDPRIPKDVPVLYFALLFYRDLEGSV